MTGGKKTGKPVGVGDTLAALGSEKVLFECNSRSMWQLADDDGGTGSQLRQFIGRCSKPECGSFDPLGGCCGGMRLKKLPFS